MKRSLRTCNTRPGVLAAALLTLATGLVSVAAQAAEPGQGDDADKARALKRQNAALRSKVRALSSNTTADVSGGVYARTAEEARTKIIEELLEQRGGKPPVGPEDLSALGLCQGLLSDSEAEAISKSLDLDQYMKPELDLAFSTDGANSTADQETISTILGDGRYREIKAECKSIDKRGAERERDAAIITLSAYLGLPQDLAQRIRELAEEKRRIFFEPDSPTDGASSEAGKATDDLLEKQNELRERQLDSLACRFRETLGPERWERYKAAVLVRPHGVYLPTLYWISGPLFDLPRDEAEAPPHAE